MTTALHCSFPRKGRVLVPVFLILVLILACSAPVPRPTGVAYEFDSAKDMFKKGRFDKALDFTDNPASASPANAFTERALLLRVAIYSGQVKGLSRQNQAEYKRPIRVLCHPMFRCPGNG